MNGHEYSGRAGVAQVSDESRNPAWSRQAGLRSAGLRGWLGQATLAAACLVLTATAAIATSPAQLVPPTWGGMNRVNQRGLDRVYLRQGVDLTQYKKIMLDPVEVAFDKSWSPRRTSGSAAVYNRVDAEEIRARLGKLAQEVATRELEKKGGYPLVDAPGDGVLHVRARIVDLYLNAPDSMTPGVRTFVQNAGEMTLIAELYDSQSNLLIGGVIDRERGSELGFNELQIANRVTNTAEADRILTRWATKLRNALDGAR